ncbi:MAG: acyltransferase family protein [Erysipelotrichaceae bacterium]|nr:acyltransferase family protein [Erysipelotrichaceae bacterium]
MKTKIRIDEIDLIKALGIILIVAGHAGFPCSPFINYFHVSVFFMASGYVYKPKYSFEIKTVIEFIWKKIRFLLFPYFLYNTVLSLLHTPLIYAGFYSLRYTVPEDVPGLALTDRWTVKEILINIGKGLLFRGDNELIQGVWFIKDLFIISIIYCIVDYLIHVIKVEHLHLQTVFSLLLLCLGFYLDHKNLLPYGIARILSYYSLYHLGIVYREKQSLFHLTDIWTRIITVIFPLIIFIVAQQHGLSISLVKNRYPDPFFLLICALAGWLLCYEISEMINQTYWMKKAFLYLGRNSYIVLLLHIICFKPIVLLKVTLTGAPIYRLSSIPNYKGEENGWWLIYVLSGILLPMLYCVVKGLVFKSKKKGI